MMPSEFQNFPDNTRIWIFGADRELEDRESAELLTGVDGFLRNWAAHGVPLHAARSWCHDRFLIVGADTEAATPSGCSIDALVGVLREMELRFGVRFLGNEAVWFRDARDRIRRASRPEFRGLAKSGGVTPASVVFDNSITELAQLRAGQWEGPARDRWHSAFFD